MSLVKLGLACPRWSFGAGVDGGGFIGAPGRRTCRRLAAPCLDAVLYLSVGFLYGLSTLGSGSLVDDGGFIGAPGCRTCLCLATPCSAAVVAPRDLSLSGCPGSRLVWLGGGFIGAPGRIISTIFRRWLLVFCSSSSATSFL